MVPAPAPIAVELRRRHPMLRQVLARGPVQLDRPRRRYVICRHRVAQHRQHPRSMDLFDRGRLRRHPVKVRSPPDIRRIRLPPVRLPRRKLQQLPVLIAVRNRRVLLPKHLRIDRRVHRLRDLLLRRPDILQIHRLAILAATQRIPLKVVLNMPSQRIRDHQRWTHQIIRPHLRRYATFKVTISAQHTYRHQRVILDRRRYIRRQRPRVADTRRTPIPHNLES